MGQLTCRPLPPARACPAPSLQAWPLASLRQYIQWAKTAFQPMLSEEAEELLSGYYQLRRQHERRQASRTTVRMLESLVRVAQAHARLMARQTVRMRAGWLAGWLAGPCCRMQERCPGGGIAGHSMIVPSHARLLCCTRR